ncbi:uncharacterized protein N7511_006179 [Penicillium nucicola]|uniref:uncharacterized protein n=1 Tax=Penicillium nucicola TaxID=1850975 RepID=UPI002544E9CC|nr:uncharacterized protein N7511_006179 [Penicillium nucicola]KAJ5757485.1 hypothetical protein N7511_006179 [Penicillium nucicola]
MLSSSSHTPSSKRRRDTDDSSTSTPPVFKAPRTSQRRREIDLTSDAGIDLTEDIESHVDLTRESGPVPQIDLTGYSGSAHMSQALEMQHRAAQQAKEAAAKADAKLHKHRKLPTEEGRTILTAYKCPVCMDTPENATSTSCGHLFCHKCISECVKMSEQVRMDGSKPKPACPVCRKTLTIKVGKNGTSSLVLLNLKLLCNKRFSSADVAVE